MSHSKKMAIICSLIGIPLLTFGLYYFGWIIVNQDFTADYIAVGIICTLIGGVFVWGAVEKFKQAAHPASMCHIHNDMESNGICEQCGKPFCGDCLTVIDDKLYCPQCLQEIEKKFKRPEAENGHKQAEVDIDVRQIPLKSKTIAILLCFFLWFLGVHRFYIGHTQAGLAYLLATIVSIFLYWTVIIPRIVLLIEALAALVDLFQIAKGSYLDSYGRKLV